MQAARTASVSDARGMFVLIATNQCACKVVGSCTTRDGIAADLIAQGQQRAGFVLQQRQDALLGSSVALKPETLDGGLISPEQTAWQPSGPVGQACSRCSCALACMASSVTMPAMRAADMALRWSGKVDDSAAPARVAPRPMPICAISQPATQPWAGYRPWRHGR